MIAQLDRPSQAGFPVRLGPRVGREPDVFFIRAEHADGAQRTFVDGDADLVIEILSPSTPGALAMSGGRLGSFAFLHARA
jgi:Uma2 family endonuclease